MTLKEWLSITSISEGYAIRINGKLVIDDYHYNKRVMLSEHFDKEVISVSIHHSMVSITVVRKKEE